MDRWNGVAVRAYWPAAFALVVALVSMAVLSHWQASPLLAGFVVVGRWVPLLARVCQTNCVTGFHHSADNGTRSSPNISWKLCSAGFQ